MRGKERIARFLFLLEYVYDREAILNVEPIASSLCLKARVHASVGRTFHRFQRNQMPQAAPPILE